MFARELEKRTGRAFAGDWCLSVLSRVPTAEFPRTVPSSHCRVPTNCPEFPLVPNREPSYAGPANRHHGDSFIASQWPPDTCARNGRCYVPASDYWSIGDVYCSDCGDCPTGCLADVSFVGIGSIDLAYGPKWACWPSANLTHIDRDRGEASRRFYAKRPFGGAQHALPYLGQYTHRIAISKVCLSTSSLGRSVMLHFGDAPAAIIPLDSLLYGDAVRAMDRLSDAGTAAYG